MLRDKSLIPLSRQHQHALALCVRIDRAQPVVAADLPAWQAEIARQFEHEIKIHFDAEERIVFPVARRFPELVAVVDQLQAEHAVLRNDFSRAESGEMSAEELSSFARHLSEHIRKEERQFFEGLQALMKVDEIEYLGRMLEEGLKDSSQVCSVPKK